MRVIHVLPGATVGGAEAQVLRLSNALDALGVEVCIYFNTPVGGLDTSGIAAGVEVATGKAESATARVARLWRFIGRWNADIVHVHMSPTGYIAGKLRPSVRLVGHHHTAYNPRRKRNALQSAMNHALLGDITFACSEAARVEFLRTRNVSEESVHVVYNGLDFEEFDRLSAIDPGDPAADMDETFLFAATKLGWAKGTDILFDALAQLSDLPGWQLALIGDDSRADDYKQQARQSGVLDRIRFLGQRPLCEIPALLSRCNCFIQVSRLEGLGIAIIEAAAAHLPVVGTSVGGIPEVVIDRKTGLLIPSEDVPALAAALSFMVENPQEAVAMGQRGRSHVEQRFEIGQIAQQTCELYRQLLQQ